MTDEIPTHANLSRADICTLAEADLSEIASFIAAQSGRSEDAVEEHLRWFLLENPARGTQDPLGFGLRSGDRLVGCILCSPQTFRCGSQVFHFMGSSSFYVDRHFRGHGGRIFLQYSRLGRGKVLFGTSANPHAATLWKAAGAVPIPDSEGELFGILRWPPIAEELVHRKYSQPLLTRIAGSSISRLAGLFRPLRLGAEQSSLLRPLASAEQATQCCLHDSAERITALRDSPYLHWRYFSGHDRTAAAFAFRRGDLDGEVLVTMNLRLRGHRGQIRTLNVLDVYPEVSPADSLKVVAALAALYRHNADAIVLRNQNSARREWFRARGFLWRAFDAPTGWFLDQSKLLPTRDWYPVPADGDCLI